MTDEQLIRAALSYASLDDPWADKEAYRAKILAARQSLDSLATERDDLAEENDRLHGAMFPELRDGEIETAVAALTDCGVSSERVHASWARHVANSIIVLSEEP